MHALPELCTAIAAAAEAPGGSLGKMLQISGGNFVTHGQFDGDLMSEAAAQNLDNYSLPASKVVNFFTGSGRNFVKIFASVDI